MIAPARSTFDEVESLSNRLGDMRGDYSASKRSGRLRRKRRGIPSMGSGADWHYRNESDLLWMSEVAHDIDRNDVIMGSIVDRVVDNTIQTGFRPNPNTGDEKLDADLVQRWDEESADPQKCDVAGNDTFHDQEQIVLRSMLVAGDIFPVPVQDTDAGFSDGQVQMIESHRCRSPSRSRKNIVHGIEMDEYRRRVRYWFAKESIGPYEQVLLRNLNPVTAYDFDGFPLVWHVYKRRRTSQSRGVTSFAPLFDAVGMHDDVQFAKLLQQQLASFFAFVRNRDQSFQYPGGDTVAGVEQYTDSATSGLTQEGVAPGQELKGLPGERIEPWSPNIPNPEFFPHVKLILTFLGVNLGMPLVMVLMDASETNFSGYRGAIEQARMGFRRNQRTLVNRFHRPAWAWRIRNWLDKDAALAKVSRRKAINIFRHTWDAPRWPYIQPLDDAEADILREGNFLISPRRRAAERGEDFAVMIREVVEDRSLGIRLAIEAAANLNDTYMLEGQDRVLWRDIYQPPAPASVPLRRTEYSQQSASIEQTT